MLSKKEGLGREKKAVLGYKAQQRSLIGRGTHSLECVSCRHEAHPPDPVAVQLQGNCCAIFSVYTWFVALTMLLLSYSTDGQTFLYLSRLTVLWSQRVLQNVGRIVLREYHIVIPNFESLYNSVLYAGIYPKIMRHVKPLSPKIAFQQTMSCKAALHGTYHKFTLIGYTIGSRADPSERRGKHIWKARLSLVALPDFVYWCYPQPVNITTCSSRTYERIKRMISCIPYLRAQSKAKVSHFRLRFCSAKLTSCSASALQTRVLQ